MPIFNLTSHLSRSPHLLRAALLTLASLSAAALPISHREHRRLHETVPAWSPCPSVEHNSKCLSLFLANPSTCASKLWTVFLLDFFSINVIIFPFTHIIYLTLSIDSCPWLMPQISSIKKTQKYLPWTHNIP